MTKVDKCGHARGVLQLEWTSASCTVIYTDLCNNLQLLDTAIPRND